jgi:phosphoribosylamine---glycine ligase
MNVLLLGSGGREHTLAWKIAQSPLLKTLYWAPGNAAADAMHVRADLDPMDFEAVATFCERHQIDLVVPGPENPLVAGLADFLREKTPSTNLRIAGPNARGAMLEGSKAFAKEFMQRHGIPTAAYREFDAEQLDAALDYLGTIPAPYVLKADGLAAGKGVVILDDLEAARSEIREMLGGKFGDAGKKVVVEAFLKGTEFSVFILTDGQDYVLLPEAKDYKRIGEGDTGLNTGGMGAISPVAFFGGALKQKVLDRIVTPTLEGLQNDGIPYRGFIFFGLIEVDGEPFVIEYNCRLGDPETEAILPRIESDLLPLLDKAARGDMKNASLSTSPQTAATVMIVSGGYPGAYEKGKNITGLQNVSTESLVFHAGTASKGNEVVTNGGRVIAVTGIGNDLPAALKNAYTTVKHIHFEKSGYRKDIGQDLLKRQKT